MDLIFIVNGALALVDKVKKLLDALDGEIGQKEADDVDVAVDDVVGQLRGGGEGQAVRVGLATFLAHEDDVVEGAGRAHGGEVTSLVGRGQVNHAGHGLGRGKSGAIGSIIN